MIIYVCDMCEEKIPIVKKKDIFTRREIEVLDEGKIKCEMLDLSHIPKNNKAHLCKTCAQIVSAKIDNELLKFKLSAMGGKL